jgi:predicted RNase H-like nuclease
VPERTACAREVRAVGTGRVLGVDACPGGWLGVTLDGGDPAHSARDIGQLVARAEAGGGPFAVVAVDIPIGVPGRGPRLADLAARQQVGGLWPAVFLTPVREALEAPDHATAVLRSRELTDGQGVSIQAYGLRKRIFAVEQWIATRPDLCVVEVHPEVCFAELAGGPLTARKATWAGIAHRRRLLAEAGVSLPDDLGPAGAVAGVDDVLDAAAAWWTAKRVSGGTAYSLPDPPERLEDGRTGAIWC